MLTMTEKENKANETAAADQLPTRPARLDQFPKAYQAIYAVNVAMKILRTRFLPLLLLTATSVRSAEPELNIEGLNDAQYTNVRAFLSLTQEKCDAPDWRIEKLFAKADSEIGKALRALGYYRPKIGKRLRFVDDCWQAHFSISAGEPVRVHLLRVEVQGEAKQQPTFQKLLTSLPLHEGDILNHASYEKIKQDLQSLALELGFLKSKFSKKSLRVNPKSGQADIELIFDSGPRHRFGHVNIDQDILDPVFIRRYVSIQEGDYYSTKTLAKTYNELSGSQYFSNIDIEPHIDEAVENRVPIDIDLTPKKNHRYSVGAGFATDIGPLGSLGYQNRRLNKLGHRLTVDLSASPVLSQAEGQYLMPYKQLRNDYLSVGLGYKLEQPDTFESEAAKLSLQQRHVYQNGWKQTLFLDLSRETFTVGGDTEDTTLIVPGMRWQYTRSDNALRPTRGYQLNFSIASAPETWISDVMFLQTTASGKLITPLPWPGRLISRANLGATLTDDFHRLPPTYRFYAGGTETIRGYEYKKLGPSDDDGNIIGGKMLSVFSIEYEHFINDTWGVAAFIDSGNAYNPDNIEIKTGIGLGLRWLSPIGPLRLDFAVPLNETDSSFQFHFAAGAQL